MINLHFAWFGEHLLDFKLKKKKVIKRKVNDIIISSTSVDGFIGQIESRSSMFAAVQNKKWDLI